MVFGWWPVCLRMLAHARVRYLLAQPARSAQIHCFAALRFTGWRAGWAFRLAQPARGGGLSAAVIQALRFLLRHRARWWRSCRSGRLKVQVFGGVNPGGVMMVLCLVLTPLLSLVAATRLGDAWAFGGFADEGGQAGGLAVGLVAPVAVG